MRWIWIDKFVEFESGRRAVAVKNVTRAEEYFRDHFPEFEVMPASLIIEGMAQTAGILVGEARAFKEKVILAKLRRAIFHRHVLPGDQLRYEATIENVDDAAAQTAGTVTVDGERIGEIDIVFSHIDQNLGGRSFPKENFVFHDGFMRTLDGFEHAGKK
jgi:3-hydroxyacyl-[acyl-carrier-protein] dehydratase